MSDGDVGEALVTDGLGGDELAGGGLGLASLLSHAETAEVLGLSRGAVRVLLHRAVVRLRQEARKP